MHTIKLKRQIENTVSYLEVEVPAEFRKKPHKSGKPFDLAVFDPTLRFLGSRYPGWEIVSYEITHE